MYCLNYFLSFFKLGFLFIQPTDLVAMEVKNIKLYKTVQVLYLLDPETQ